MRLQRSLLLLAAAPILLSLGCAREGPSVGAAGRPAAAPAVVGDTLAVVDGQPVTRAEVDERAAARLLDVRQQEYEVRKRALDEIVSDRLLEKAAAQRGIGREALLKAEVDDKVPEPDAAEVEMLYQQNKFRFADRPKAEIVPQIARSLREQRRAERERELRQSLRKSAQVKVSLRPPRVEVPVPPEAPSVGPAGAPITIVEFLDYQCPYCQRAEATVAAVLEQYKGRVRLVTLDYPLPGHPRAMPAARAARCAREQGKYWEYHRALLAQPTDFSDQDLGNRARTLGLDVGAFATCVASSRFDADISKTADAGNRLGVAATPTFFVNGQKLNGALPLSEFQDLIEGELAGS